MLYKKVDTVPVEDLSIVNNATEVSETATNTPTIIFNKKNEKKAKKIIHNDNQPMFTEDHKCTFNSKDYKGLKNKDIQLIIR